MDGIEQEGNERMAQRDGWRVAVAGLEGGEGRIV